MWNAHTYTYGDTNADSDAYGDTHTDSHTHSDTYADFNTNAYNSRYGNPYAYLRAGRTDNNTLLLE